MMRFNRLFCGDQASVFTLSLLMLFWSGCRPAVDIQTTEVEPGEKCQYGGLKVEILEGDEVKSTDYVCNQRIDGHTSLIDIQEVPVGSGCEQGGIKVQVGLDLNDNGVLDPEEITGTHYVCHGRTRLMSMNPIPPGGECETGGIEVNSGFDLNGNGVLDEDEIDSSVSLCHGRASLVKVTEVPEGGSCPAGGIKVETGFDSNGNHVLDPDEVQGTEYVCNGEDGYNTLVEFSDVPADPQGECYFGGTKIQSGLDENENGVLDPEEVTSTRYVCSVQVNSQMTLVEQSVVYPGEECTYGGIKVEVGIDENDNGVLDPDEVTSTTYQCNEVKIVDGKTSLIDITPASSSQCPYGGYILQSGIDENRNGELDAHEVDQAELVCNGANGYDSVSNVQPYSGSACGENGGYLFQTGLDLNKNGVLDDSEVTHTSVICNGEDGEDGQDGEAGYNSLIKTSDAGSACGPYGGIQVEVGLDTNENGILDWDEVESTEYVCNGLDGLNSLIRLSDDDGYCGEFGGVLVEVGLDLNENNVLDDHEVEYYSYVCNGWDGYSTLVEAYVDYYPECGGEKGLLLLVGLDYNYNGFLEDDEIYYEHFICENWETYHY